MPEAQPGGLTASTPGPLPSASGPAAHVKTPGEAAARSAGHGGGPIGGFRPGPSPSLGDGGTFRPPPLTRGVWPQPGALTWSRGRGQGHGAGAQRTVVSMGRRCGWAGQRATRGGRCTLQAGPGRPGCGHSTIQASAGFYWAAAAPSPDPGSRTLPPPTPVSEAPLGLGPFCAPGSYAWLPQRSVSTLAPVTRTPQNSWEVPPHVPVCVPCLRLGPAQDLVAPTLQCAGPAAPAPRGQAHCLLRQRSAVRR